MAGVTFDAGALIAAERDSRHFQVLLDRTPTMNASSRPWYWRGRGGERAARSVRITLLLNSCQVEVLDEFLAKAAGELLSRSGMADAVDASAARRGDTILTSDPDDLRQLAAFARGSVAIAAI